MVNNKKFPTNNVLVYFLKINHPLGQNLRHRKRGRRRPPPGMDKLPMKSKPIKNYNYKFVRNIELDKLFHFEVLHAIQLERQPERNGETKTTKQITEEGTESPEH